jgi:S-adenosylmethionine synthetase
MGVYVTTFGTGAVEDDKIAKVVASLFDFRPAALIETLDLRRPIYSPTAAYGHFGRTEKTFSWERTDRAAELADALLPKKRAGKAAAAAGTNGKNGKHAPAAKRGKRAALSAAAD